MAKCDNTLSQLRRRVTIQKLSRTPDGQGGFTESWSDLVSVWASIEPLKAWERMQAMQLAAPTTHKVVIRYRTNIDATVRLVYGYRIFSLVGAPINIGEENVYLRLDCLEQAQSDTLISMQDGAFFVLQSGNYMELMA